MTRPLPFIFPQIRRGEAPQETGGSAPLRRPAWAEGRA